MKILVETSVDFALSRREIPRKIYSFEEAGSSEKVIGKRFEKVIGVKIGVNDPKRSKREVNFPYGGPNSRGR